MRVHHTYAIKQATALARAQHPNVVTVYSIEDVIDPVTNGPAIGVVLELLKGPTLSATLLGTPLQRDRARNIGIAILDGIAHMHKAGVTHGDLHPKNVMIDGDRAKIIDILYYHSLSVYSTQSREVLLRGDLSALRVMLSNIITHSECGRDATDEFHMALGPDSSLADIRAAFDSATLEDHPPGEKRLLDNAYELFVDPGFVDSQAYAEAVSQEISDDIVAPLLLRVISRRAMQNDRFALVKTLGERLPDGEKLKVVHELAKALEKHTPRGDWPPHTLMLAALGDDGWRLMPNVGKLRLERMIVDDILKGRRESIGFRVATGGQLGAWAKTFFVYFQDADRLVANICTMLRQESDTLTYAAYHFLSLLPEIARTPQHVSQFSTALASALRNRSFIVRDGIAKFPADWIEAIRRQPGVKL